MQVDNLPAVLSEYLVLTANTDKKAQRNSNIQAAREMLAWVNSTLLPKLYGTEPTDTEIEQPMPTQGELPPSTTQKSLNELIQQLADAIKCPAEEVRVAAKALIIKHNPIVNDLFGGSS